jgi:ankyrin repeat protein
MAASTGRGATVKQLLGTDGVDPDPRDSKEQTPLSRAARRGQLEVAELLIATEGINPDSRDSNGQTPLSHAAQFGKLAVVELLIARKGVNPDSRDNNGRSPLWYAAEYDHGLCSSYYFQPRASIRIPRTHMDDRRPLLTYIGRLVGIV